MTVEEMPTDTIPAVRDYEDGTAAAELSACKHQKVFGFRDNETALGFQVKGDYLLLGEGSANKYARDFMCENMALLRSEDGKTVYGLGYGHVIIMDQPNSYSLPDEPIHLTIGEPCVLPGLGTTEPIAQAMLCYRPFQEAQEYVRDQNGELVISPFIALAERAIAAAYGESELTYQD